MARLYSGNAKLELDSTESASERNLARKFAVIGFITEIDKNLSIHTDFHDHLHGFLKQNKPDANLKHISQPAISILYKEFQKNIDATLMKSENTSSQFTFMISLKSKRVSHDWAIVESNLQKTINTILSNKYENCRIVICGHEYPSIEGMQSEYVDWVQADFPIPKDSRGYPADKMKKRRLILQSLKDKHYSGYVVPCDADDWIHKDFCRYISALEDKDLFVLDAGCLVNLSNKEAWIRPKRFYIGCGTSSVVRFDAATATQFSDFSSKNEPPYNLLFGGHGDVIQKADELALAYEKVCLPLVCWVLANGENISIDMGKKSSDTSAAHYAAKPHFLDDDIQQYFFAK